MAVDEAGRRPWAWPVLVVVGFMTGAAGQFVAVPAPYLLAGLLVGAGAALSGTVARPFPCRAYRASQAMVGVLMGCYLQPATLRGAASSLLPFTAMTVTTVGFSVGIAVLLSRCSRISHSTATLGMVPGGSAAIMAAADDLAADSRLVALAQYTRVGIVALTAPLVVSFLSPPASQHAPSVIIELLAWHPVNGTRQLPGLLTLTAAALLGARTGERLRLPAPFVLGPMLITALVILTGTAGGFAPAGPLQNLAFICVGLEIGLRFNRASLTYARRHLARLIAATLAVTAACMLLAWPLATLTHLPFTDAYMATTPGGINAILATAMATHADVPLISTVQSLRLFAILALMIPLIRWALARTTNKPPTHGRHAKNRTHRKTDPVRSTTEHIGRRWSPSRTRPPATRPCSRTSHNRN